VVTARLIGRGEGMQVAELGPGHGAHLRGGVQLHRAGAQRDHRLHEREVAALQAGQVTEHLRLGLVLVEHRMPQEAALAGQGAGADVRAGRKGVHVCAGLPEGRQEVAQVLHGHGLVQGHADAAVPEVAQVDAAGQGRGEHIRRRRGPG
jgi:hypothetical protein